VHNSIVVLLLPLIKLVNTCTDQSYMFLLI